jgi:hypothetical protein
VLFGCGFNVNEAMIYSKEDTFKEKNIKTGLHIYQLMKVLGSETPRDPALHFPQKQLLSIH